MPPAARPISIDPNLPGAIIEVPYAGKDHMVQFLPGLTIVTLPDDPFFYPNIPVVVKMGEGLVPVILREKLKEKKAKGGPGQQGDSKQDDRSRTINNHVPDSEFVEKFKRWLDSVPGIKVIRDFRVGKKRVFELKGNLLDDKGNVLQKIRNKFVYPDGMHPDVGEVHSSYPMRPGTHLGELNLRKIGEFFIDMSKAERSRQLLGGVIVYLLIDDED